MLRRTNKNKKYALRKVGKYFGSCVIGTMIAIGVATTIPSNEVHAAQSEFVPYKVYDVTITPDQPETVYKADDTRDVGYRHEEKGTPGKQEIWTKYESRYYFMDEYDAYKNIKGNVEMLDDLYLSNKYKTLDEEGNIPAHPNWEDDYVNNNGEEFPKRIDENGDGEFTDVSKPDPVTHEVKPIEHKVESNKKFVALPDTVTPDNSDQSSVLMDDHGYGYSGKEEVVADYDSDNKVVRLNPHYYEIRDIPKVDTVITLGTKPKVVTEEIAVTTTYTDDPTLEKGKEVVVTEGEAGSKETVTRYAVNKDTGEITETTSVRTIKEMVPKVVKRGTKESGTDSNLKVAQPTIAIVEEPDNKASIQVKAPKKDADTVEITYPKSDGSGNEVLTLTKQSSGEWTLDKQPENVTLDKKTGTVTIPREAIVNKQKVQARSKNGNSDFSQPVYEVLSIEEAKPEHPVTRWIDKGGKKLRDEIVGKKELAGTFPGYKWLSSRLEDGILTHTFEKIKSGNSQSSNLIPEKPSSKTENPVIRTVWRDENGKDLKTPSVEKQEAGEVEGYEFVESHREGDNLTVHVFRTKKSQTPSPAPAKVSEQKGETVATSEKPVENGTSTNESDKAELPNTGTETNASLASAGIMTLLAGLGLGFFKKKEDEN